jgi:hypothetical protein
LETFTKVRFADYAPALRVAVTFVILIVEASIAFAGPGIAHEIELNASDCVMGLAIFDDQRGDRAMARWDAALRLPSMAKRLGCPALYRSNQSCPRHWGAPCRARFLP